ncbi:reverse transcriptase domain-containing protein [Artemisia annua]|uniref:Reverse transcriptase domain-containing protein n=1 Tax=Artemisia annua TaxID=35608 RepID=A0A2U1P8L6_ARTAN|nr:reverse transcriptase domain-containing protein [Artemisia annua]
MDLSKADQSKKKPKLKLQKDDDEFQDPKVDCKKKILKSKVVLKRKWDDSSGSESGSLEDVIYQDKKKMKGKGALMIKKDDSPSLEQDILDDLMKQLLKNMLKNLSYYISWYQEPKFLFDMPPRRNRNLNDIHEQEFEQRVMARMEERMGQFVDQLTDHMNDLMNQRRPRNRNRRESEDEERPRRNEREDNRRWESGLRVNIPDFDGDTLNPEGFIDWLAAVEEVFEFKDIPENKRVPLITTKLRGRASAWWQQLKLTRERVGKPKVTTWQKMKKCMRANFIPHNYQRLMYQRLQNLKQGAKSVEDYTTEFYQLIARNDIQETEEQLVSRYIGVLRFQIMDSVKMFDPVTLSDAHQRALDFEKQNRHGFC